MDIIRLSDTNKYKYKYGMNRMIKLILIAAITLTSLTGCVVAIGSGEGGVVSSSWKKQYKETREKIAKLNKGEGYESVIKQLGTPQFNELVEKNNIEYRIIFYPTHSIHSDGKRTKDECTPIVFVNGGLEGFGTHAYNKVKI